MALVPKQSLVPPGGFHFVDSSSGQAVRIEGESTDDVASKVLKYRLANSLPVGNPLKEVNDYICGNWSHFCDDPENLPRILPTLFNQGEHISRRVASWMADFVRNYRGDPGVGQNEAERRAAICANCPQNIRYDETGCGACLDNIARLAFVFKANRQTGLDSELRGCKGTAQHNGCAVWAKTLPPVPDGVILASNCWRK